MVTMTSAPFKYIRPDTVAEASRLLSRYGGSAKLLAGGHSLVPLMKLRLASPKVLIDLSGLNELKGIKSSANGLSIGSMTTYYELESSAEIQAAAPLLADAASQVADAQVRNFGTIGGAVSHSDPAADLPAVVLALDAVMTTETQRAGRQIPVKRFFRDFLTTALRQNEVLTRIEIPKLLAKTGTSYIKQANKAAHYAVVGVAAVITLGAGGVCERARVAITGAGPYATRAKRTERILVGKELKPNVIRNAAKRAGAEIEGAFNEDVHASAEYREAMTQVFAERAITAAVANAR
jgi:carbon-monoxide dehydrogenase medium subunit